MKSVQIPYDLFIDLAMYHLRGEDDFEEEIRQGLEQKLDAMLNRQLYSQYKTAPTEEQREQARQEYLDRRGVPQEAIRMRLLLLGNCDRSVPRSCCWRTRQIDLTHSASPVPIEKPADFEMDKAERIFRRFSLPVGGSVEANSDC